jgi:hypothetical protein
VRLLALPDILRDAGFDVHVEAGWDIRGSSSWGPVKAIMAHHTATAASRPGDYPSLVIVRDGRLPPDPLPVPGPLSQLGLGRSGKVYVIASGRANHAGAGSHPAFAGSFESIGIEAEHPGGTVGWPRVQYDAYVALCAALADAYAVPTALVVGHKEWAPTRKVDPNFSMTNFRRHVQEVRNMADHNHVTTPGVLPRWHSDEEWQRWCEFSGTNPDTALFEFYRYDWAWAFGRAFVPLLNRITQLEREVATLQRTSGITQEAADARYVRRGSRYQIG